MAALFLVDESMDLIYARQSVDKEDGISIENQIELCLRENTSGEHKIFKDKGYSGKNTERPAFQEMMSWIRMGGVERVIAICIIYKKTVNTYIEKQKEEVFYLNYKEEKVEMKKATLQAWAKIALKDGLINNETYIKMSREIEKIKA